jgi:Ni,Fe-hydrogenase III small subunit
MAGKEILERFRQGRRTLPFPAREPKLPDRFRGRPVCDFSGCPAGCKECAEVCPSGALRFSGDYSMAARSREALVTSSGVLEKLEALSGPSRRLFGRSLKLRQVSAGGCNACEADAGVLGTVVFDLGRFGIQFTASPRHADGLLITGPVTRNMAGALRKTYDAVPPPKIVIASGACAVSGGPFAASPEVAGGAGAVVPVDLYRPGCPPIP